MNFNLLIILFWFLELHLSIHIFNPGAIKLQKMNKFVPNVHNLVFVYFRVYFLNCKIELKLYKIINE